MLYAFQCSAHTICLPLDSVLHWSLVCLLTLIWIPSCIQFGFIPAFDLDAFCDLSSPRSDLLSSFSWEPPILLAVWVSPSFALDSCGPLVCEPLSSLGHSDSLIVHVPVNQSLSFFNLLTSLLRRSTRNCVPYVIENPVCRSRHLRKEYEMSWRCHGGDNSELVGNLQKHGILTSEAAAEAMRKIDRADFVPDGCSPFADCPQPIGYGATISAPHMHGYCLSLLANHVKPGSSVLDVGSGSGYLTTIFALMVGETGRTVGVEHIPQLVQRSIESIKRGVAAQLLETGVLSIHVADGKQGYPEKAPYDAIHVGAAAAELPQALVDQLKPGGRMVIPVGQSLQNLLIVDKAPDGSLKKHSTMGVRYVPLL